MRKNWNGNPPKNDEHARQMLLDAALDIAARDGVEKTNIKKVAAELGITRQTVYRLYASSDDLQAAVSTLVGEKILNRLLKSICRYERFEERAVETIIILARDIPNDPILKHYFQVHDGKGPQINVTFSTDTLDRAAQFLKQIHPAPEHIQSDLWLHELAEHMQRLLLSIIIAPSERTRSPAALRKYLNHWFTPLVATQKRR